MANIIMEGRYGGPQVRIAAVAEKLKIDGIETIAVFPRKDSDVFNKKLFEKGIQTRRITLHRLTKQRYDLVKYIVFFIPELLALYKLLKRERIDIVHCNGSWQFKGPIAGKMARANVVWHLNDNKIPFIIKLVFKILAASFCDGFITAGNKVREYYLDGTRLANKYATEIQAPVDISIFDPEIVKQDPKIASYSGTKIVTVGNINPLKGLEYFITMASILNERNDDLLFFIIGPSVSSQRKYLQKLLVQAENMSLTNLVFYGLSDDIPAVLKAADIYICSSVSEASPISVWEAMAMGKAIVSTDVGDVSRFIQDGVHGYIVPPKDASVLANKVELLIKYRALIEKMGAKAREIAINKLDVNICVNKHIDIYNKIYNRKNNSKYL